MGPELTASTSPKCGHCGARLTLPPGASSIQCEFCGTQFDAPRASAVPALGYGPPPGPGYGAPPAPHYGPAAYGPPPPGQVPVTAFGAGPGYGPGGAPGAGYQAPASGFKSWMVALYIIPVIALVSISTCVSLVSSRNRAKSYAPPVTYKPPTLASKPTVPIGERINMDTWTEAPAIVAVDDDGTEDLVGRYSVFENGKSRLYVGAFDGTTFKRIWKIGPLAELGTESSATRVGVTKKNVLVADSRATLHVYDVATGEEAKTLKLSDRAERIFPATNGANEAWIKMSDKQDVLFDGATSTLKVSGPPSWMPEKLKFPDSFDCEIHFRNPAARARCIPKKQVPAAPSFAPQNGLVDGDDGVALGNKSPGTRTPTLVGFDAKTKKLRWTVPVSSDVLGVQEGPPKVADLVNGRIVVAYATTSGDGRVAAFDAKTGNRLWDASSPKVSVSLLSVTPNRVYVPAAPVVRVYDARSGRLLGSVGTAN